MSAWPSDLPQTLLNEGLTEEFPNLLLRTQMDNGPAKVRRRFTAGVRTFIGNLILTTDQVDIFNTFFMTTLKGGALSFQWKNPRTGVDSMLRIISPPPPKCEKYDAFWKLTLVLEILP